MVSMVKYVVVAIMQDNGGGDCGGCGGCSGVSGAADRKRFFSVHIFPGASIWIR